MTEPKDHLKMALKSIEAFNNDGRLDTDELAEIMAIAEQDGCIDADEVRVLRNIISKLKPNEMDAAMKAQLDTIFKKINSSS